MGIMILGTSMYVIRQYLLSKEILMVRGFTRAVLVVPLFITRVNMYVELTHSQPKVSTMVRSRLSHR